MDALEEIARVKDRSRGHGRSGAEKGFERGCLFAEDKLLIVEQATCARDDRTGDEESRETVSDLAKCQVAQCPGKGRQRHHEDG